MANITTQTLRVDLNTGKVIPTAYVHQNDTARTLVFSMYLNGAAYTMTGHRGIPFLDLFHQSNLRPWRSECNAEYFSCDAATSGDGLHPNSRGHKLFYRQILDFVSKIVMH